MTGIGARAGSRKAADTGAVCNSRPMWSSIFRPGALAFQQVAKLPKATWPEGPIPQQLHLDLSVPTMDDFNAQHERAIALGAKMLRDRLDDPEEPLRVYADPAGHPFCIFVSAH